jgi:hypothetical protein
MEPIPRRIGKYEILDELGRGAMGTVYRARDPKLDRVVALKVMSRELDVEPEMKERFKREAQAAAKLKHPNIVTVYDFDDEGDPRYFAMELLEGTDLAAAIDERQLGGLPDKLRVLIQICRGLDYAHKSGVIHRDVKPSNIQVLPDGTVKILDFGIAWRDGSTLKTKTGLVLGTPTYMAPEQITGGDVDGRADMWAVGVIAYEMLGGRRPFSANTIPGLIYAIVHSPPPALDARISGLPANLVEVVNKALAKRPEARFRDLSEMGQTLQTILGAPASDLDLSVEAREKAYVHHLEAARTFLLADEPARALEAARRARTLEPGRPEVATLIAEIEARLREVADQPTVVVPPALSSGRWLDQDLEGLAALSPERRVDEARMALARGERTEALRITEEVLSLHPGFAAAVELRELLGPPVPRQRTDRSRTMTRSEIRARRISSFREEEEPIGDRKVGLQVIAIAPEEHLVAAGGLDGGIRLWDLERRTTLAALRSDMHRRAGHEGLVTSLAFSHDGAFLVSGHVDGAVHVWQMDTGTDLKVRVSHDGSVGAVAFSPDGNILATGGMDSALKLWEMPALRAGDPRRTLHRQPAAVTALAFLRNGAWIMTGHTNRILRLQDASSGRLIQTFRGPEAAPSFFAVSPDGNLLACGGRDHAVRIFDLTSKSEVHVLKEHNRPISSLAFFPDGEHLASVAMDNTLILWDLKSGSSVRTLWGKPEESFASVGVFAQGRQLACGLSDGRIKIWAAAD